jgi:hypothetical protein
MTATTDAPDTVTAVDTLDVGAERLRAFVASEPDPSPSVVLGWALADPEHEDVVAAWLQARPDDSTGRAAVADGGLTALSGAGDREHDTDNGPTADGDTPALHDEDGHLVDGHGRRLYEVTEDTARLHHAAVSAGWRHSYDLAPYQNLRSLVELVEADRRAYKRLAFRFILGYGPGSTPQALDRLGVTA